MNVSNTNIIMEITFFAELIFFSTFKSIFEIEIRIKKCNENLGVIFEHKDKIKQKKKYLNTDLHRIM